MDGELDRGSGRQLRARSLLWVAPKLTTDHDTLLSMPMRENLELVKIERSCEVIHTS